MATVVNLTEQKLLYTPQEVAQLLNIKINTLAVWRSRQKEGPNYIHVGRKVLYPVADLHEWIESQKVVCFNSPSRSSEVHSSKAPKHVLINNQHNRG